MHRGLILIAAAGLCAWTVGVSAAKPALGGARPTGATLMSPPAGNPPPAGTSSTAHPALPAGPAPMLTGTAAGPDLHGPLCAALARLPERLGDRPAPPADVTRLLATLGADCPAPPRRSSAADAPDGSDE